MGKLRGVKREIVRVDISGGDWVDLKRALNVGEKSEMIEAATTRKEDSLLTEQVKWASAQVAAHVTNWSLCDINTGLPMVWPGPQRIEQRLKAVRELDDDTLIEIRDAIVALGAKVESEAKAGDPPIGDSGSSNS